MDSRCSFDTKDIFQLILDAMWLLAVRNSVGNTRVATFQAASDVHLGAIVKLLEFFMRAACVSFHEKRSFFLVKSLSVLTRAIGMPCRIVWLYQDIFSLSVAVRL